MLDRPKARGPLIDSRSGGAQGSPRKGCMGNLRRVTTLLLVIPFSAEAQDKPQIFVGAHVIPIAGPEIPDGVVVVEHGKIVAVGPQGSTKVPAGGIRHDLSGKFLMPGLVD